MPDLNTVAPTPTAVVADARFTGELPGHEFLMTGLRTGNTEVYRINPYTGDATNLTRHPSSHQRYPMWSPDGSQFLFTSDRDGTYNLYLAQEDGTRVEQLTHEVPPSGVYFPSWSQDTNMIAYGVFGSQPSICLLEPGRREIQTIAEGRDPHISPDGLSIAFTRWVDRGYCVFVLDLRSSQVQQLTSHENSIGAVTPTFSPDGLRILYSDSVGGKLEIFSLDLASGKSTQLTKLDMFATSPAWSPDQRWISFRVTDEYFWNDPVRAKAVHDERRGDKRPVWVMGADGSKPHVLEALRYQCAIDGSRAVWHPGGTSR